MHQLEHGYTRIANTLLDSMAKSKLPSNCWRIIFWAVRESYGFERKHTRPMSNREIGRLIKMDNSSVDYAISTLVINGVLVPLKDGGYRFNKSAFSKGLLPNPLGGSSLPNPLGTGGGLLPNPLGTFTEKEKEKSPQTPLKEKEKDCKKEIRSEQVRGVGGVCWENCNSDIQRFLGYYAKVEMPDLYNNAKQAQVNGFFKRYCKAASEVLAIAGDLDTAKRAFDLSRAYFNGKGLSWNLSTVSKNIGEFVNQALSERRKANVIESTNF